MRSEAEIRRAFYLLGAVVQFNDSGQTDPMPEGQAKLLKHGHSLLAWVQGKDASFARFLDTIESMLAAENMQIVECEGGARVMPLRDNHRPQHASTRKR